MNKENIKLIIFDFDGVIADTFDFCFALQSQHYYGLNKKLYRKFFDGNIYDAQKTYQLKMKRKMDWWAEYNSRLEDAPLIKGVDKVIKNLSAGYHLSIVSSTITRAIKPYLSKYKLLSYFDKILGPETHRSKINKIKSMLKTYKLKPSQALFVTDTLGDITEARHCGLDSVAVTWGYQSKNNLKKGSPLAIVDRPDDLVKLLL